MKFETIKLDDKHYRCKAFADGSLRYCQDYYVNTKRKAETAFKKLVKSRKD